MGLILEKAKTLAILISSNAKKAAQAKRPRRSFSER